MKPIKPKKLSKALEAELRLAEAITGPAGRRSRAILVALEYERQWVEVLKTYARLGLKAHHGERCDMAPGAYPENPAECVDATCREWAKALEE